MSTYNLSNNKVPAHLLQIIEAFQTVLGDRAYDFILIGASARDLVMDSIHELGLSRLTKDVDFALYVPEWSEYTHIRTRLIDSGKFSATKIIHKLIFDNSYEIDIVPFGDIQNEQGQYTWPPENIKAMNVAGFIEVNKASLQINTGTLKFKVASLPGICIMKLLAWHDRGRQDDRDGKDLGFILANYIDLIYDDLYTLHEDLMIADDFDRIITTGRIIGRDIYRLLSDNPIALQQLRQILTKATADEEYSRLAIAIKRGGVGNYKQAYLSLSNMQVGLSDSINDF